MTVRRWSSVDTDEVVAVALSSEERALLRQGLHQWGGPTRPTDALARVIGFDSVDAMHAEARRIREALKAEQALTKRDWRRALVATEIVFASNYYGAGNDWEAVTGWDDERTLQVLRNMQSKLAGLRAPWRHGSNYDSDH